MIRDKFDVVVIGAGAAGLSAAGITARDGRRTAVIDREECGGGILLQCIHNGFGLHHFGEELTGPEYAERLWNTARDTGVSFYFDTTVNDVKKGQDGSHEVICYSARHGVMLLETKTVVLAMGCRERNRGNIGTPGTRPSGVFTAGLAQRLLNIDGYLPGREAVIIGSGDIGLIMARRLTWVGIQVKCVVEILPHPSGLTRNVVQCLHDFDIPLYLSHAVTRIDGADRVSGVQIAPLTEGEPDLDHAFNVECDTVLLSVGLVPENELSRKIGIDLSGSTGGAVVDAMHMTNIPGIFACGNVLHVHDLVDFVSSEAEECAASVIDYLSHGPSPLPHGRVTAGANLRYVSPGGFVVGRPARYFMRAMTIMDEAQMVGILDGKEVYRRKLRWVKPAEMISVDLPAEAVAGGGEELEFRLI